MSLPFTDQIAMFTPGTVGVKSTRTSYAFDVSKRQVILVVFTASDISSGNGVFTVDGSADNSYWVTGIAIQDASTTLSPGLKVSKTFTANGTFAGYIQPGWKYVRTKVTVTTDGRYTATLATAG